MSYSYVSKKVYKPFKQEFDAILSEMQIIMRKEHNVTMEIRLVGSGANNCVTKDDSTRFWDLDYNIIIQNLPDKFAKSPDKLKEKIRVTIDRVKDSGKYLKGYNISFGKNSTVPITYKVTKNNKPIMGVDIAIIRYDKKRSLRLVFDKPADQYISNELSSKLPSDQDILVIRKNGMKQELRKRYLQKKNDKRNIPLPSYVLFNQAVNEVLKLVKTQHDHSTSTKIKEVKKMAKISGNNHSKSQMDHHSNQKNPNNSANRAAQNNRSNQLNPNNAQFRGGNSKKSK